MKILIPIEYRIENEDESVTLDFKREVYRKDKKAEFLKDVAALANGLSNDLYRYIVIGVKEKNGLKEYFDVKRDDIGDVASYQQLIDQNIEPNIPINIKYVKIEENNLAIFEIGPCNNPPFVFKKDYENIKQGVIYIRNGTSTRYAKRQELDLMYQNRHKIQRKDVLVGFNEEIVSSIKLPALSNDEINNIPSKIKRKEIENELEKRKLSFYDNDTPLKRLDISLMLEEKPLSYKEDSESEQMLINVKKDYRSHDNYYLFEQVGKRFNLYVHNQGREPLKNCTIKLKIPIKEGLRIAFDIYNEPGSFEKLFNNQPSDYPYVDKKDTMYIVTEKIDTIKHKLPTQLFKEKIRIIFFPKLINSMLTIQYEIYADNYPDVISGDLFIEVIEKY